MSSDRRWKSAVERLSKRLAAQYGFTLYRPTCLVKMEQDIALTICFDFPPSGMKFHIAAQPLYTPEPELHLTFGRELRWAELGRTGPWGMKPGRLDPDLAELEGLVETEALPFFQKVSSPRRLIRFLKSARSRDTRYILCPPVIRYTYLAYSYLRVKRYLLAPRPLRSLLDELSAYTDPSSQQRCGRAANLLRLIEARRFGEIDQLLDGYSADFRTQYKLSMQTRSAPWN